MTRGGDGKINQFTVGAALAAALLLLGVLQIFMRADTPSEATASAAVDHAIAFPAQNESIIMKARKNVESEKKKRALEAIANHERSINADFNDEQTPDRLMAVGNLHQYQIGDYYSAIENYRMMVDIAPNHNQTPQAYIEIATCYERLGEEVQAMYVYREMTEKLDPSLQHAQFAKLKLESQ
jgi:tetratricopeptide (TPR) repeat protein